MARLLVVEDDETIGRLLSATLRANGHTVEWQRTGVSAVQAARGQQFDLVLLDLGLPDIDGVEVCRDLRADQPQCVIVMLTARRDEMDVVVGLEAGADDYLTKPFGRTELLARVRAHLRRRGIDGDEAEQDLPAFTAGDLVLDTAARRMTVRGVEIQLRAKEFDLLARLVSDVGRALSRETLMAEVWDENWFGATKTLDVHIAALRRHFAEATDGQSPPPVLPTITTLRGHGYRLDA